MGAIVRTPAKHPWLTMRQAAALIGWTDPEGGRRLKWRLLTVQRLTAQQGRSCRALIETGKGTVLRRYATTEPLLRRWCPELFATAQHLPEAIERRFSEVNAETSEQRKRLMAQGSKIRAQDAELQALRAWRAAVDARLIVAGI